MSVTRLKRKHRKNIARANNETAKIKNLLRTPVLKNVDLDELKSRFAQTAPASAEAEKKKPESESDVTEPQAPQPTAEAAKPEGLLSKMAHAATAAADAVKHAASDAVEAVSHNSVVEKVKDAATHAVDAVTHTAAYETAQQAAHNVVEGTRQLLNADEKPQPDAQPAPAAEEPAKNEEAQVNQTGTEGFDEAEAVTKPVNEDGQEGEHPKPEIEL